MFGGIVEGVGVLRQRTPDGDRFFIEIPNFLREGMKVGESLSVSGACLTISEIRGRDVGVDLSPETLERTTFSTLDVGAKLNLERPLRIGDRLHGHWVTGHIDGIGTIASIQVIPAKAGIHFKTFTLELSPELFRDMVPKGSLAVDGVSLTVNRVSAQISGQISAQISGRTVEVMLIPQTLETTTLGEKKVGDRVHLELDLIGKYVKKWMNDEQD